MPFSEADIYRLPEPAAETETRAFQAAGREWEITISKAGLSSAEAFFDLAEASRDVEKNLPLEILIPPAPGARQPVKLLIKSRLYAFSLAVLARVAVEPAFSLEQWAIFGHKVGGAVMNEITDWAASANGLGEEKAKAEMDEAKNECGAEGSQTSSSAPASSSPASPPSDGSEG